MNCYFPNYPLLEAEQFPKQHKLSKNLSNCVYLNIQVFKVNSTISLECILSPSGLLRIKCKLLTMSSLTPSAPPWFLMSYWELALQNNYKHLLSFLAIYLHSVWGFFFPDKSKLIFFYSWNNILFEIKYFLDHGFNIFCFSDFCCLLLFLFWDRVVLHKSGCPGTPICRPSWCNSDPPSSAWD